MNKLILTLEREDEDWYKLKKKNIYHLLSSPYGPVSRFFVVYSNQALSIYYL